MKEVILNDGQLSPEAEELVNEGLKVLKNTGFKITKKRREILSLFAENQQYLSALAIHKALEAKYPTMSYNTTYRNLYDFVEVGILETTEYQQEQLFRYNCHLSHDSSHHHHHHFICTNCGKTILLDACPMQQVTTDLSGVEIQSHRFEVFGLCAECKNEIET
ncbi:Fur family transcriptional regulator [Facklamia miroungae]|uniref:Fur family transcriptional regulator, zinc uptake regulator n=1 Tax=Facklamia miroungae TaxID=120956 RepID=A0A1G7R159_9LACT|nr:Fur family transcriptional regulator [Facklamia miroungae]NKZ29142.1 transcriptional repressor [Facklamia miroungae]SDG04477.1 Fur family transcriptional regulator, zinc uptake regulator [Facklamia miroungae]